MCSLQVQLPGVAHNCRLRVMRGEADDDITQCRSVLRLLSHAMGADHVAGVNLHVEFTGSRSLTSPSASSVAVSPNPRILTVLRREYCSRSTHRSSRLTTLTCKSSIWASFFPIVSFSDLVIVTARAGSNYVIVIEIVIDYAKMV